MSQQDVTMQEIMGGMYGPNQYSRYQNQRIPMPGYVGMPNDSQGNPIAPPPAPGTTLNSTPAQAAQPTGPMTLQQLYGSAPGANALNPSGNGAMMAANWGGMMGPSGLMQIDAAQRGNSGMGMPPLSNDPSGSPSPAAPTQGSMTNALSLLANPARVSTPGATVPQAPPTGQGPSVLANFLANNKGGKGAGNYDNSGFFSTLSALKGS